MGSVTKVKNTNGRISTANIAETIIIAILMPATPLFFFLFLHIVTYFDIKCKRRRMGALPKITL